MKVIQIGEVFGDTKSVEIEDTATLGDALKSAKLSLAPTQQLVDEGARNVSESDIPDEGGVYLIASRDERGVY